MTASTTRGARGFNSVASATGSAARASQPTLIKSGRRLAHSGASTPPGARCVPGDSLSVPGNDPRVGEPLQTHIVVPVGVRICDGLVACVAPASMAVWSAGRHPFWDAFLVPGREEAGAASVPGGEPRRAAASRLSGSRRPRDWFRGRLSRNYRVVRAVLDDSGMAQSFVGCDRDQSFLMPPDVRDWLAEDHLAWFVLDAVAGMNLGEFYGAYRRDGVGRRAYDPAMMACCCIRTRGGSGRRARSSGGAGRMLRAG